jgi:hypothetical protein
MTEAPLQEECDIGSVMADGTIYIGFSPTTRLPIYAAPADALTSMVSSKAEKYAKELTVGNKKDFHLPDKEELQLLFMNKEKGALKGTLNVTGSNTGGWYSSSATGHSTHAYGLRFSDGAQGFAFGALHELSVRCVRYTEKPYPEAALAIPESRPAKSLFRALLRRCSDAYKALTA